MPRRIVVPPSLLAVARRQAGLVSSAQCDEHLVLRGARARLVASGRWRRLTTGVLELLDATEQLQSFDDRRLRSAWLAMLAYGPEAMAVGACALALHGVAGLPVRIQPQVALPAGRPLRPRDGIRVRHFDGFARVAQGGRELACLDDALVQALPELHRLPAVAVLDNVLNRRLIDEARLAIVRERLRGRRGAAAVDEWWHLVDGRAESPLETEARLRCIDDGIPPDDLQVGSSTMTTCSWRAATSVGGCVTADGCSSRSMVARCTTRRRRSTGTALARTACSRPGRWTCCASSGPTSARRLSSPRSGRTSPPMQPAGRPHPRRSDEPVLTRGSRGGSVRHDGVSGGERVDGGGGVIGRGRDFSGAG